MGKGYPIGTIERGEVINPAPHEKCITGKIMRSKKKSSKLFEISIDPKIMNDV
jgi:hypothetical protein